jgi:hypothetical protein
MNAARLGILVLSRQACSIRGYVSPYLVTCIQVLSPPLQGKPLAVRG